LLNPHFVKCKFCEIIKGLAPAYFVYKSSSVVAFLDRYPVSRGHTLVVPVEHYSDLLEAPDWLLAELVKVVKKVAKAQVEALEAGGVRIIQNNGSLAGQVVFHLHFHVIPCYAYASTHRRPLSPGEGEAVAAMLRRVLEREQDR